MSTTAPISRTQSSMSRIGAAAAVTLATGIGLGIAGRGLDHLPNGVGNAPSAIGGPWLVAAFAAAFFSARLLGARRARIGAALAGAAALATGAVTYYAIFHAVEGTATLGYAVVVGAGWAAAGVAIGAIVGALAEYAARGGAAARTALAGLGGLLVGEALVLLGNWRADELQAVALAQLIAGAAVMLAAIALPGGRRPSMTTFATAPAAALAGGIGAVLVRETLRAAGWAGA